MSGIYIAAGIIAANLTTALGLHWYVLAGYLVASTTGIVAYYRVTR